MTDNEQDPIEDALGIFQAASNREHAKELISKYFQMLAAMGYIIKTLTSYGFSKDKAETMAMAVWMNHFIPEDVEDEEDF